MPARRKSIIFCIWLLVTTVVVSSDADRLAIFGANTRIEVPVQSRSGAQFVDLGLALSAEGRVELRQLREGIRLKAGDVDLEVRDGDRRIRVHGKNVALDAPAVVQGDALLVPNTNLVALLRAFTRKNVVTRGARIFIGDAPDFVSTELRPAENSMLVLRFRDPVNPGISTEGNRLVMRFDREPAVVPSAPIDFDDKTIRKLQVNDAGTTTEMIVTGNAPLLADFEEGNRMIVIKAAPAAVATVPAESPAEGPSTIEEAPGSSVVAPQGQPVTAANGNVARSVLVAIDAAHGGSDAGVRFSEKLLEKDLSLAIADKVRAELANRGISTIVLRNKDQDLGADERAEAANAAKVVFYISLHAGQGESGVRIYRPLPTIPSSGLFARWDSVQSAFGTQSDSLAKTLASQFGQKRLPARILAGNVAPMIHVAAATVAVEVAPAARGDDKSLESAAYQQKIAQAVAAAIADERSKR